MTGNGASTNGKIEKVSIIVSRAPSRASTRR